MNERFHIIITGESGRSFSLQLSKHRFYISVAFTVICAVLICVFGYFTTGSYFSNKILTGTIDDLQAKLESIEKASCDYSDQIAALKKQYMDKIATMEIKHREKMASMGMMYQEKVASMEMKQRDKVTSLEMKHSQEVAAQKEKFETLLADQQVRFDLKNTNLQLENVKLMTTAVSDLKKRSELIESVMGTIGIKLKKTKSNSAQENSGGPFIADQESSYADLLQQVDTYLETIRTMPLGRPVKGPITSPFGKRTDPVNNKKAIHEGVDIRGTQGDRIKATARGKIIKAQKNGGYGNYVEIDHGNGYHTVFGHMQNYLVKKGEYVEQGQVIGQVGSTGRSTGPHLHYEIRLNNKPVNPSKFMKVSDLSHTLTITQKSK